MNSRKMNSRKMNSRKMNSRKMNSRKMNSRKMNKCYLNRNSQPTGAHKVHQKGCGKMPEPQNQIFLGQFSDANEAIKAAKRYFDNVELCYYCFNKKHKK